MSVLRKKEAVVKVNAIMAMLSFLVELTILMLSWLIYLRKSVFLVRYLTVFPGADVIFLRGRAE